MATCTKKFDFNLRRDIIKMNPMSVVPMIESVNEKSLAILDYVPKNEKRKEFW